MPRGLNTPAKTRAYPKGKVGGATGGRKVSPRKPRVTAKPNVAGPRQKPVQTPPKKKHVTSRAGKAKSMSRRGAKGPVQYKGMTRGLRSSR